MHARHTRIRLLSQDLRAVLSRLCRKLLSDGQFLGRPLGYRRCATSRYFRSEMGIGIGIYCDDICKFVGSTGKHVWSWQTRLWRRLADAALRSSYPNQNMQGNLRGENAASGRTGEVECTTGGVWKGETDVRCGQCDL